MKLSAVVITRNEEANIARCLESLRFCDEIVVVDAISDDRTREIARRYTTRVYARPWAGYTEQKNYAVGLAEGEWVLSVDADEVVSDELRAEVSRVLSGPPIVEGFYIARRTIHFGRWIRHGGWYPNRLIRLFRKSSGKWVGGELHERWECQGLTDVLPGDLVHYSFTSLSDQVERNNHYSSLGALSLRSRGEIFRLSRLFLKPFSKFLETYVVKRGFLDGYPGFIISVSAAYSVFLKWSKLWELEHGEKKA